MKTDWDKAIQFVLTIEKSDTVENDPNDPGGTTKYGISQRSYPHIDIPTLTIDQAKMLYRRDFWEPCGCDELPSAFAIATFDCAVNQGMGPAKRLLQIALDIEVDGVIGPKTIAAAFKAEPWIVKKLLALRLSEYFKLMTAKPNLQRYATNWCYRVVSLAELILAQAVVS